jgi:hypothetical protein
MNLTISHVRHCNAINLRKKEPPNSSLRGAEGDVAIHLTFLIHLLKSGNRKKDGLPRPFQGLAMTSVGGHSFKFYPPKGVVLLAMTRGGGGFGLNLMAMTAFVWFQVGDYQ